MDLLISIFTILYELIYLHIGFFRWFIQIFIDKCMDIISFNPIPCNMEELLKPTTLKQLLSDHVLLHEPKSAITKIKHLTPKGVVGDGAQGTYRAWVEVSIKCNEITLENSPDDIDDGDKEKQIRLFIKLHPPDMMIRTFINMIGLYANENRFFNEIADTIPSHLSVKTYCSMKVNSRQLQIQEDLYACGTNTLLSLVDTCMDKQILAGLNALAEIHSIHWCKPYKIWNEKHRPPFTVSRYKLYTQSRIQQITIDFFNTQNTTNIYMIHIYITACYYRRCWHCI